MEGPARRVYVVHVGRKPGIYHSWAEASCQVLGFSGAVLKRFDNEEDALRSFNEKPVESQRTDDGKASDAVPDVASLGDMLVNAAPEDLTQSQLKVVLDFHNKKTGSGKYLLRGKKRFLLARWRHALKEISDEEYFRIEDEFRVEERVTKRDRKVQKKEEGALKRARSETMEASSPEVGDEDVWKEVWPNYFDTMIEFRRENNLTVRQFVEIFGQRFNNRCDFETYLRPGFRNIYPVGKDRLSQDVFRFLAEFEKGDKKIESVPATSPIEILRDRFSFEEESFRKLGGVSCFFKESLDGILVIFDYESRADCVLIETMLRETVLVQIDAQFSASEVIYFCNPSRIFWAGGSGTGFYFKFGFAVTALHVFDRAVERIQHVSWMKETNANTRQILRDGDFHDNVGFFDSVMHRIPQVDVAFLRVHLPDVVEGRDSIRLSSSNVSSQEPICGSCSERRGISWLPRAYPMAASVSFSPTPLPAIVGCCTKRTYKSG